MSAGKKDPALALESLFKQTLQNMEVSSSLSTKTHFLEFVYSTFEQVGTQSMVNLLYLQSINKERTLELH